MEAQTPAAPAPSVEVTPEITTVSASVDAASRDDFSAFDAAELAAKKGTPLPVVERAAPVAKDAPAPLSKRQQAINDSIREAVDRATADSRAEVDRLRAQLAAAPVHKEPAAPVEVKPPAVPYADSKRYADMPDAPKLEDFESIKYFDAAMAMFVFQKASAEARETSQTEQHEQQRARFLSDVSQKYGEKLIAAREADPDFLSKIPPAIHEAMPLSGLPKGAPSTFANVAAEAALYSEDPATFYKYLHANRGEVDRIAQLPTDQWLATLRWLDGRLSGSPVSGTAPIESPAAPAVMPSTITSAPAPPQLVQKPGSTTDPQSAALKRDDFAAFDRIEQQKMRAKRSA